MKSIKDMFIEHEAIAEVEAFLAEDDGIWNDEITRAERFIAIELDEEDF